MKAMPRAGRLWDKKVTVSPGPRELMSNGNHIVNTL
jgi:hypothetical protein